MRKLVLKQGGDDLFAFAVGKIFFRPKRRNPKEKKKEFHSISHHRYPSLLESGSSTSHLS